jgi:hypothetical protein
MKRTALLVLASIASGLVLGLLIRRVRVPAPPSLLDTRSQLPSRERIGAALLRAEIRDLHARVDALREEGERVERERLRLASLSQPPPPASPESLIRRDLRSLLGEGQLNFEAPLEEWLKKDLRNISLMMKIGAEVYREKDWGRNASERMGQFFYMYCLSNAQEGDREKLGEFLARAQQAETDSLVRAFLLGLLDSIQAPLPDGQLPGLARAFQESSDPVFRKSAFALILRDAATYSDLIRDAVREGANEDIRARYLLMAWDKRALSSTELRRAARDIMKSDQPSILIMEAQDWVPKYINPLAPEETVALFDQTLAKPIEPVLKAISLMVMGSIATLFPNHPGRPEIERFSTSTGDPMLKEFAGKVGALVDEGKSYSEIRKLNPLNFGFEIPK